MGLDMYAYVAAREGQHKEYWEGAWHDKESGEFVNEKVGKPLEIAYWRKHPNLHGWMEALWAEKGYPNDSGDHFNGIELELTSEDIDRLESDIKLGGLPNTEGFFFGDPADNYYYEEDLEFVRQARYWLFMGAKVFYNSSW